MWNLKYDTSELIYRTETLSDIGNRFVVVKGFGGWGQQMQTIIYRTDKQQGPTVEHREPYSISCDKL